MPTPDEHQIDFLQQDVKDLRELVLDTLKDYHESFKTFEKSVVEKLALSEERTSTEIREYKRTVNSAIGALSKELLDFQDKDSKDRSIHRKINYVKDGLVIGVSCFVIVVGCGVIATLIGLLYYFSKYG